MRALRHVQTVSGRCATECTLDAFVMEVDNSLAQARTSLLKPLIVHNVCLPPAIHGHPPNNPHHIVFHRDV